MATEKKSFCHLCQETFVNKEDISLHVCVEIKQETLDLKSQDYQNHTEDVDTSLPQPPLHLTGLPL